MDPLFDPKSWNENSEKTTFLIVWLTMEIVLKAEPRKMAFFGRFFDQKMDLFLDPQKMQVVE